MKKHYFKSLILLLAVNLASCSISPVDPQTINAYTSYADYDGINIKIDEPAPNFNLLNAKSEIVSLSDFKNKKPVLLLFYRGDWCAYCLDQLDNYQALLPELEKYNLQLIAISPDNVSTMKNTQKKFGQNYIFLSDSHLTSINEYGVGNDKNLPHPSLFLIDKKGILKWYYSSTNHKVRPTAEQVDVIIHTFMKPKKRGYF